MSGNTELSKPSRILHWIVGVVIIILLITGTIIEQADARFLLGPHKTFGLFVLFFALYRIKVRLSEGWPENVSQGPAYEHVLAKIIHWVLIIGTVGMPVSGLMMSFFAGYGLQIFAFFPIAPNVDAAGKVVPISEIARNVFGAMHGIGSKLLILAVVLHIVGALKHHFFDKDATLMRMFHGENRR